jgi:uncharacterized protein
MSEARVITALIEHVAADARVLALIRFGSRARGNHRPSSDTDVCLVLHHIASPSDHSLPTQIRLEYMEKTPEAWDIHVFQALPLYIRHRILRDGQVLYCRNEDALYDLAFRTVLAFEDFRPRYQLYLEQVANGRS